MVKKDKKIKVDLIYEPSKQGNFRLSEALKMLISEKDIRDYFSKKNFVQQKNETSKCEGKEND